jgi:DNA-directed RNA polymerase specialized sigma24 family protein/ribosome-associated translation inhibitor RaiA
MNVHVTYKVPKSPDIEKEINHQIEKIRKRLQVFRPELVHLKASVEQNSAREGTLVALNLRLPSGQMAVQGKASNATSAVKSAFDDLMQQITRHKELLRSTHKWRRRGSTAQQAPQQGVPFEQTVAAVTLPSISGDDIRSYINVNLSRLQRFVERELYFRNAAQDLSEEGASTEEVVDEVVARALGDGDRPEKLALEPWLYRLAMDVMDEIPADSNPESIHLEESRRRQNVQASDEVGFQFHQPDEGWTRESTIPDRRITNPEQARYSDEMLALVHAALKEADRTDREAFLLYGMEGFSLPEVASITGRHPEAVRESVERARDLIRNAPSMAQEFPKELLTKTRN